MRSTNIGAERPNGAKSTPTGIDKRPMPWIRLRPPGPKHGGIGSGVEGDFIGDRRHHGGDYQAVYAVAREQLDHWETELDRKLHDGMFGENITTAGLDVDHALIGERWQVGETVLQVCGPRIPCGTFREHMAERGWLKRFVAHELSGAYLSIETPGTIRPGDPIEVIQRPDHDVDVPTVFRAFYGDKAALRRVVEADCLPDPAERQELRDRFAD
ncbi:MOSC domain-containing protein [Calidifontibacter terrae]